MKTDIQAELTQALLPHEKVWANEEKTILAKNILLDLVEKTDPSIIGLLLGNDELKRHFFVEVNGVLVFKLQDFRFFLDKHSVNNSYTKYANRIGLTDGNRFLKDSADIVLDFPFKDCVLNGGQSSEESEEIYFKHSNSQPASQPASQLYTKLTRKRQEIFFNQTLAFDEIDRLFDAKAFSNYEFPIDEDNFLEKWEEDEIGFYKKGAPMRATGTEDKREDRPEMFYPFLVKNNTVSTITDEEFSQIYNKDLEVFNDDFIQKLKEKYENLGYNFILPIADKQWGRWRWGYSIKNKARLQTDIIVSQSKNGISLYKKQRPELDDLPTKKPKTIFYKPEYSSGNGTEQMKNLFGEKAFKNPKPEELIQDFITITTNENDIVLDYHLGSGTTAAVAHKMNRQYIGIEQMDYIETLAVERLKKVIEGEQGGISKAVNWQGGGEFVYAELAPFNETAKQQILACEDSDGIKTLFEGLCERYFLKYNVSVNEFSQIIQEPEFQSLPLDEQKQMVLEMLDLNQMYVSLSEMDDEQFAGCLNDDDKALSRAFYQAEKKDGE
ncbi:TPA: site-specific DNA-methyltransferase [Neisseria meningitidis]